MWSELPIEKREKYKLLIQNFASLSKVFSQKSSDSDDNNITPIVNSKFQETAFQKAFDAISEDIANTSYDASVKLDNNKKYLVGIKSFGYTTGYQKVAQFKSDSAANDWSALLYNIKKNINNLEPIEANKLNINLYKELAIKIANLRNARIASSKAQIKGFEGSDIDVESIYHVLMPFKNNNQPQILVGQIPYLPIDINNIKIIKNEKNKKHPQNFEFSDGKHKYRYTSSDSQLLMDFKNKEIVLETWDINYLENPFYFFENLNHFSIPKNTSITLIKKQDNHIIIDSVCWMIPNENGELEESSGFNAFDGSTKLGIEERKLKINQIQTKYRNKISTKELDFILDQLQLILLKDWKGKVKIKERKELRTNLITFVQQTKNTQLLNEIEGMLSRSSTEMYIPIPESKTFHNKNPNFFGKNIGTFKSDGKTLALSREKRLFKLEFIPSGNIIVAYINQQSGKAIQSINNQDILGKWILWEVFQLKERELLTSQKLNDIGINGIRLIKFKDPKKGIGLEFIWIDEENPPKDAIGWVAKNKKKRAPKRSF